MHHHRRGPEHYPLSQSAAGRRSLRTRLRELANLRRRFGHRRLHVLLHAEGHIVNRKKAQRLPVKKNLWCRNGSPDT
ncbi:hypothetical protein JSE7799_02045 [Jannaschia seosinensis]|uniref:HTH-like domain-containing protein n=1 Tax=Jannaschia seosinensis TaxID=313367 RepID=A0A0M7BAB4_9RHOB|nr:hypothetical protein JSE7799_02045 [Jannaschia seosinensis]